MHISLAHFGEISLQKNIAAEILCQLWLEPLLQNHSVKLIARKIEGLSGVDQFQYGASLPSDGISNLPSLISYCRTVIKMGSNSDLIICFLPTPVLSFLADFIKRRTQRKVIVFFSSMVHDKMRNFFPFLKDDLLHYLPRMLLNNWLLGRCSAYRADRYVVSSLAQKHQLIRLGCMGEKIKVIYNTSSDERCLRHDRKAAREIYGLGDEPVIGYMGHFKVAKGINYLIRAMPTILSQFPETKLVLAYSGRGNSGPKIRQEISSLNLERRVRYMNTVNVAQFLAALDVLALPYVFVTESMNFPYSIIEAFHVGVPLITTALEPLTEIVIPSETGMLIHPGKPEEIAQAVITLLQNPDLCKSMRESQNLFAQKNFSHKGWEKQVQDVISTV